MVLVQGLGIGSFLLFFFGFIWILMSILGYIMHVKCVAAAQPPAARRLLPGLSAQRPSPPLTPAPSIERAAQGAEPCAAAFAR